MVSRAKLLQLTDYEKTDILNVHGLKLRTMDQHMEAIMIKLMGITIESREEQRKREEEALYRYFRYGAKHRNKVGRLLEELIPGEKREHLILYYMQIKDRLEMNGGQKFEEAVRQIKRKYIIISANDTVNRYYKAVMEADAAVQEDLCFPCADEIRKMVEQDGKDSTV